MEAPSIFDKPAMYSKNPEDDQALGKVKEFQFKFNKSLFNISVGLTKNLFYIVLESSQIDDFTNYYFINHIPLQQWHKISKKFCFYEKIEELYDLLIQRFEQNQCRIKTFPKENMILVLGLQSFDNTLDYVEIPLKMEEKTRAYTVKDLKYKLKLLEEEKEYLTDKIHDLQPKDNEMVPVDETYPNGNKFQGYKLRGKREGQGKLIFSPKGPLKGDVFIGNFVKGEIKGFGTYFFNNGDKYEGNFEKGMRSGNGTLRFKNGELFEGCFKDNKIDGFGVYRYKNGERYEGWYKNNKKNGVGVYYYNNGNILDAQYKDGVAYGKGVLYYPNGEIYVGEWEGKKSVGKGYWIRTDGKVDKQNNDL